MKKLLFLSTILTVLPGVSMAESSFLPLSMQHKFAVEVGTGIGTGNVDNENISVSGDLVSTSDYFTNELKAKFADVEESNGDNDETYKIDDKIKYQVNEMGYVFGQVDHVNNEPAGIKGRSTAMAGYGHKLLDKENLSIVGEVGAGYRDSEYTAGLADESDLAGKVGTIIDWVPYDNINVNNTSYYYMTGDNSQSTSDTSIKSYVYDNIYVKGSFNVENNNNTPTNVENTDTMTSVNLGYEF